MASQQFEHIRALLEEVRPTDGRVDIHAMRRTLAERGGALPDGVLGTPTRMGGVPAAWIDASGGATDAVILYLHGGGYVAGSIDSHRALAGALAAAARCRVLVLDYRLAPEHPYPAALDDALAAYGALVDAEGIAPSRVVIAGDSAGGGLTMKTLVALRDAGAPLPRLGVLLSPWVDLAGRGESVHTRREADVSVHPDMLATLAREYIGALEVDDPRVSPLYADHHGLPPLFIQVGDAEILLDDSTRLAASVRAAGGDVTLEVWPEMWHVWQGAVGYIPEAAEAIAGIARVVRAALGLGEPVTRTTEQAPR